MTPSREQLVHRLYEAAELEHNLMCTYLYAAFSLRQGAEEGLTAAEAEATARWKKTIVGVAIEEMGHLAAVWNITSALGGSPRFGRWNFPLDPGILPASIVVKLAPFGDAVIQHFIHLERPRSSNEPEGEGFAPELMFTRGTDRTRLTPMALDYETVGVFYATLEEGLQAFVAEHGADVAFCGDPALQLGPAEVQLDGAAPVRCLPTALAALASIVEQGEGAPDHSETSHYARFAQIREELAALRAINPDFHPAFPAAVNPVLRPPPKREGRVWIEEEQAAKTVDLANTCYALMLRLLAYSYLVPRDSGEKGLAVALAIDLMHALGLLGERAARMPAGPSNPHCNAGVSFTALRDTAPLPPGPAARRFFLERFAEIAAAAATLDPHDPRTATAARLTEALAQRARRGFAGVVALPIARPVAAPPPPAASRATDSVARAPNGAPIPRVVDGVDELEAEHMTLLFDQKKCIHSRHCVTGAPEVFLANVKGPWIKPDAMDVDLLAGIAHVCPSGAIRYRRKDGHAEEPVPPVNLIALREAGPYAVRAELRLDGAPTTFYRATLCRCGGSKNKPFCDGTHHEIHFDATGEPATVDGKTDMLATRDGPLAIDPLTDGPYQVRGNLEITSGTGRVVARVQSAKLCRCGASNTKPFCDGTHVKIGFRSDR
ncbi:MAG TPA: ferritin-like domain-containing protein [Kofleriaceae bacterium]|nr:ferritin-like domain-containing protein [Kofleriaceae bacterium]